MKGPSLGGNNNSARRKEKKVDQVGQALKRGCFEEESTSKEEMKRKEKDAAQLETSKTARKSIETLKKKKKKHAKPVMTESETSGTTERAESLGKTEKIKRKKHIGESIAEDQIVFPHEQGDTSTKKKHRVKKRKKEQEDSETAEHNNLMFQQSSSKKKRMDNDAGRGDTGSTKCEETVEIKPTELNRVNDSTAGSSLTSSHTKIEKKKRKKKPRRNWHSSDNKKAKKVFESLLSKTTTIEDETTEEETEEETIKQNVPELPEQSKAAKKKKRDKVKSQSAVANTSKEAEEKPDTKEMSISYLQTWKKNRENWHFQKSRQLWLIRNIYSDEAIEGDNFSLLLEYLEGSKGGIRTRLLQEAQAIHDSISNEQHGTNSIKLSRAKEILQMLSE